MYRCSRRVWGLCGTWGSFRVWEWLLCVLRPVWWSPEAGVSGERMLVSCAGVWVSEDLAQRLLESSCVTGIAGRSIRANLSSPHIVRGLSACYGSVDSMPSQVSLPLGDWGAQVGPVALASTEGHTPRSMAGRPFLRPGACHGPSSTPWNWVYPCLALSPDSESLTLDLTHFSVGGSLVCGPTSWISCSYQIPFLGDRARGWA